MLAITVFDPCRSPVSGKATAALKIDIFKNFKSNRYWKQYKNPEKYFVRIFPGFRISLSPSPAPAPPLDIVWYLTRDEVIHIRSDIEIHGFKGQGTISTFQKVTVLRIVFVLNFIRYNHLNGYILWLLKKGLK